MDHVVRYCRPSTMNDGFPKTAAFMLREAEDTLSMNWMEKTGTKDRKQAACRVCELMRARGFGVSQNGRFASFNAGAIRNELNRRLGASGISLNHDPVPGDPTHTVVSGYRDEEDNLEVAATLSALVQREELYRMVA